LPQSTIQELHQLIDETTSDEPASKRAKLTGRNKKRPFDKRVSPSDRLCPSIFGERVCVYGERCKFSHDVAKFYKPQSDAVPGRCYVFETYGRCPYGITCVYAGQHTDDSMKSIVNQELVDKYIGQTFVHNVISKDMQIRLRKREYDFGRANRAVKKIDQEFRKAKGKVDQIETSTYNLSNAPDTSIVVSEEGTSSQTAVEPQSCSVTATCFTIQHDTPTTRVSDVLSKNGDEAPTVDEAESGLAISTPAMTEHDVKQSIVSESHATTAVTASYSNNAVCKTVGCVTDEDTVRLRAVEKKSVC